MKRKLFVCTWKGTEGPRLRLGKGEVTSSIRWILKRFRQSSTLGHGGGARRCGWRKKKKRSPGALCPSFVKNPGGGQRRKSSSIRRRPPIRGGLFLEKERSKTNGEKKQGEKEGISEEEWGDATRQEEQWKTKEAPRSAASYLSEGLIHRRLC